MPSYQEAVAVLVPSKRERNNAAFVRNRKRDEPEACRRRNAQAKYTALKIQVFGE